MVSISINGRAALLLVQKVVIVRPAEPSTIPAPERSVRSAATEHSAPPSAPVRSCRARSSKIVVHGSVGILPHPFFGGGLVRCVALWHRRSPKDTSTLNGG